MEVTLTPRAIEKIENGEVTNEKEMIPVLQVLELKLIQNNISRHEGFKIALSDGTRLQQGLLGRDLNRLVKEGFLQAGSVVRLTQFNSAVIMNQWIIIVEKLEVISTNSATIGHPVDHPDLRTKPYDTSVSEQQGLNAAMPSKPSGSRLVPHAQDGDDHDVEDLK